MLVSCALFELREAVFTATRPTQQFAYGYQAKTEIYTLRSLNFVHVCIINVYSFIIIFIIEQVLLNKMIIFN